MSIISKIKMPGMADAYDIGVDWENVKDKPDTGNIDVQAINEILNINTNDDIVVNSINNKVAKITMSSINGALEPNQLYVWPEMQELNISLVTPIDLSMVNEYHFFFDSGDTPTTLSLPDSILIPEEFTVEKNKRYEISILENCMLYRSWDLL